MPNALLDRGLGIGHHASLANDADRSVQHHFDAAMRRENGRRADSELPLQLDPDTGSDFGRALANIDTILSAVAAGSIDAYWAAVRVAGEVSRHMTDEPLACDLYLMWTELTDLHEFTEDGSASEQEVESLMLQAAREWANLPKEVPSLLRDYFDRWATARDLRRWRDRLGGPLFEALEASGRFDWGSA